ncbi:DUF1801 domain-containing protein [Aquabacterium sp.]|uniref:DUF1801 domain-containing protein n=1 Tax=Aquabacterium sp. TaxID=1872578 RepID=UPI0035AF3500
MRRPIHSAALINSFFDSLTADQRDVAQALQQAILQAAPHLRQEVKWGNLCFSDEGENLIAIVLHKSQAHMQVFNGAQLVDQFPQLEGTARGMRLIKCRYRQPIDQALVAAITHAAIKALG